MNLGINFEQDPHFADSSLDVLLDLLSPPPSAKEHFIIGPDPSISSQSETIRKVNQAVPSHRDGRRRSLEPMTMEEENPWPWGPQIVAPLS